MKKTTSVAAMQKMKTITMMSIMGLAAVIFVAVCVLSAVNVRLGEEQTSLVLYANQFMDGSAYLTNEVRSYVATGDDVHEENYWNEVNTLQNREIGIAGMQEVGLTQEEEDTIVAMQTLSNELVPLESAAMDLVKEGNQADALESVFGSEYETTISEISTLQEAFVTMIIERTETEINAADLGMIILEALFFILLIGIVILQVVTDSIMTKQLIKPLIACSDTMMEIATGNLSAEIVHSEDTVEMKILSESAQTILTTLSTIILDIDAQLSNMADGDFTNKYESVDCYVGDFEPVLHSIRKLRRGLSDSLVQAGKTTAEVNAGAEQVSAGAMSLADSSTEQAAFIEELVATLHEITLKTQETAASSQVAKEANGEAYLALMHSNEQVGEMLQAMGEIEEKSKEIIEIIKAIDDITFQTNILSLNAAIEAARAGTAGKGFAVVADEVRNLATQSSNSSQSIAELIEATVHVVNKGSKIAQGTADSIAMVGKSAQKLVQVVDDITKSAAEQAEAASAATEGVSQISDLVQTNAATSQESAAASEELFRQSQSLEEVVAQFTLMEES